MTNYYYISELLKKNGLLKTQRILIDLLLAGFMDYSLIEQFVKHFNWLFKNTPENIIEFIKIIEKENPDPDVQLSEDNE